MADEKPNNIFVRRLKVKDEEQSKCFHRNNRTGGEMDSVVVSSAVDGTFNPWSCQTKDFKNKNLYLMLLP